MSEDNLKNLLSRFFRGELDEEGKEKLARWINEQDNDFVFDKLLEKSWQEFQPSDTLHEEQAVEMLQRIHAAVSQEEHSKPVTKRILIWKRIAVAASVLFLIGAGALYLMNDTKEQKQATSVVSESNEIESPSANRAMITLADGSRIYLDSAATGSLATQGQVQLVKMADGQIGYKPISEKGGNEQLVYNTLTNPRGSKVIDMQLSDGSRVWLNAGSSITFPVAFSDNERKVTMDGEAYFEIAHNESKPFYVAKGNTEVKVLGTHFNVNAYDDEEKIRVTLLQGSVQVSQTGQTKNQVFLKPGQQASVFAGSVQMQKISVQAANTEQVMAWKNGLFSFDQTDLATVMRQLTRWYDVEVEYRGDVPQQIFGGDIERSLSLAQVLKLLEKSGVHFKIENRKIIVLP